MTNVNGRAIADSEQVAGHLANCFGALYRSLGVVAPLVEDDTVMVALFEAARRFGDVRQSFLHLRAHRDGGVTRDAPRDLLVIEEVVSASLGEDRSGALTAYVVAMVLGPRLLISLRDVSESCTEAAEQPLREACQFAANVLVSQSRNFADVVRDDEARDDESWRRAANRLTAVVSQAGYSESFGSGHSG